MFAFPESGWNGEKGGLNGALLRKWAPNLNQQLFWISGPLPVAMASKELVRQTGVEDEVILTDSFTRH